MQIIAIADQKCGVGRIASVIEMGVGLTVREESYRS
jgi:hypothetical protein